MIKKEVLIVDDDIITQNMLKTALGNAGYGFIVASSGREALDLAAGRLPDLIILDIMMPDMDGGEVADILKKNPRTMKIPVIFLSSLVSKEEEKIGGKKKIASFLAKPYNREVLLNEVRRFLYNGAD